MNPNTPPTQSRNGVKIIFLVLLIGILAAGAYFAYLRFAPTLRNISVKSTPAPESTQTSAVFDRQQATILLQDPETIALTRANQIYLNNLKGKEMGLIEGSKWGNKIAEPKISKSRNYVIWQSDKGLIVLDITKENVSLIQPGLPRQSYDLSSQEDKILLIADNQLTEIKLADQSTSLQIGLPALANSKVRYNNSKYSPNGELAYVRSIHEWADPQKEDLVVNLKTKNISFLDNFYNPVSLAPLWSKESDRLIARRTGLVAYNLQSNQIASVSGQENFGSLGAYALNPSDQSLAFITAKDKIPEQADRFTNPTIFLLDSDKERKIKDVIASRDKRLQKDSGDITDLGWLNQEQIWFVTSQQPKIHDLWVVSKNGGDLKLVLENFDKYSLQSVVMPVTGAYTLY